MDFVRRKFYKISEIAEKFKLHRDAVSRMIKSGKLETRIIKTYRGHSRKRIIASNKTYRFLNDYAKWSSPSFNRWKQFFNVEAPVVEKICTVCARMKNTYMTKDEINKTDFCDIPRSIEDWKLGKELPKGIIRDILSLSKTQIKIMDVLSDNYSAKGKKTQKELAELCGITRSTLLYHARNCSLINDFLKKLHTNRSRIILNRGKVNKAVEPPASIEDESSFEYFDESDISV